MGEVVRGAGLADADQLHELETQARHALTEQRGGAALLAEQGPVGDWAAALDDHTRWVGVAELDGFVVGYVELVFDGDVALVRQIYVDPPARELGFGDGLLEAARHEAQRHGSGAIEGIALPGDRETKNLFERAGMTARKIIVSTRL
ncbi:MAG TPA: GNAT family N-acetyltransferase [Ilumatobacteraceae bacterium]|nr:GNAT family N-acetyltransferase [Ilumatobacteraceae bacterium]